MSVEEAKIITDKFKDKFKTEAAAWNKLNSQLLDTITNY